MGRIVQLSTQGGSVFRSGVNQVGPYAQATEVKPTDVANIIQVAEMARKSKIPGLVAEPLYQASKKIGEWWDKPNDAVQAPATGLTPDEQARQAVAKEQAAKATPAPAMDESRGMEPSMQGRYGRRPEDVTQPGVVPPPQVGSITTKDVPAGRAAAAKTVKWAEYDASWNDKLGEARGVIARADKEYEDAVKEANAVKARTPDDVEAIDVAFRKMDLAKLEADNARGAIDVIQKQRQALESQFPTDAELALARGAAGVTDAQVAQADKEYQDALKARTDWAAAHPTTPRSAREAGMSDPTRPDTATAPTATPMNITPDLSKIPPAKLGEVADRLKYTLEDPKLDLNLRDQYARTLEAVKRRQWELANPDKAEELGALEDESNRLILDAMNERKAKAGKDGYPKGYNPANKTFGVGVGPTKMGKPVTPGATLPAGGKEWGGPSPEQTFASTAGMSASDIARLREADKKTGGQVMQRLMASLTPDQQRRFRELEDRKAALTGGPEVQTLPTTDKTQAQMRADMADMSLVPEVAKVVAAGGKAEVVVPPKASEVSPGLKQVVAEEYKKAVEAGDTARADDIRLMVEAMKADDMPDADYKVPFGLTPQELIPYAALANSPAKKAKFLQAASKMHTADWSLASFTGDSEVPAYTKQLEAFYPEDRTKHAKLLSEILENRAQAAKAQADAAAVPRETAAKEMSARASASQAASAAERAAVDKGEYDAKVAIAAQGLGSFWSRELRAKEVAARRSPVTVMTGKDIHRDELGWAKENADKAQATANAAATEEARIAGEARKVGKDPGPIKTEAQIEDAVRVALDAERSRKGGGDPAAAEARVRKAMEDHNDKKATYDATQADLRKAGVKKEAAMLGAKKASTLYQRKAKDPTKSNLELMDEVDRDNEPFLMKLARKAVELGGGK